MDTLENDIRNVIISSLGLEDIQPEDIGSDEPLFGEGLGLDSIDALELGLALKKRFGVTFPADAAENKTIFHSVASLAAFIRSAKA